MNRNSSMFFGFCAGYLTKLYFESKDLTYIIDFCVTGFTIIAYMVLVQLYEHISKKYFPSETKNDIAKTSMEGNTICDLDSMNGLDCGTHMAHSYYNGYLKVVLPSSGTAVKGLIEKIEDYEDINSVKISVHKLFILIPSSSYIPPDLRDASNKWMESAQDLPNEVRNRCGVKRREYHNTVYKIYPDGQRTNKPLYLVVEGASTLMTLYETIVRSHDDTEIYRANCKKIIRKFYEKLKSLVENDPECADICELIYYDDYKNGSRVNIAKVILDRLREQQA